MSNLAATYWNQGRWYEAEKLDVQVMETRKRVIKEEHPDTGITRAKSEPNIIITAKEISKNDWVRLQQQVQTLYTDVRVEIMKGQMELLRSRINDETPTLSPPKQTYQRKVDGGLSLGIEQRGSGTLGGYVRLRNPRKGAIKIWGVKNVGLDRSKRRTPHLLRGWDG